MQGDLEAAIKSYSDSIAIFERLAKSDSGNAGWRRDLMVSHAMVGEVRQAQGNLRDALKSYRSSLAVFQQPAQLEAGSADDKHSQEDLRHLSDSIGGLAFRFVLERDFATGLDAADQAISISPDKIWLYAIRAHALMFLGRARKRDHCTSRIATRKMLREKLGKSAFLTISPSCDRRDLPIR
jgi:tetratricopeptide (TPR) repeat protein